MNLGRFLRISAFAAAVLLSCAVSVCGADFQDGIDRTDPKFVTASLLVAGPGEELFSCVGHCFIRLECPTFKLDNCFSYESEAPTSRLLSFFAGRLKMGLFAVPTASMLLEYENAGREVRQYTLNLAPEVKQRLWRTMDECAARGADLPYDYIERGCAKSVLDCLRIAVAPGVIKGPRLTITQRETFNRELSFSNPWNLFFLNAIVGTETDTFTDVVTPKNLLAYLRRAQVGGVPLLTDEGVELLPQTHWRRNGIASPFVAAWLVFALAAFSTVLNWRWVRWAFLVVQALAGCFFVYLVSASQLPTSAWNWLLVPFNPVMPVLFCWRRRRAVRWALGSYAAVLGGWIVMMLIVPHMKTDPAFIVLGGAMTLVYVAVFCGGKLKMLQIMKNAGIC